jgi:hypothetical protein
MRNLLGLVAALIWATTASAQVGTGGAPTYCNSIAIYDTNQLGTTQLVKPPPAGGIYICGFIIGQNASAQTVTLNYSTGVGGVAIAPTPAVVVQALTPHLTPQFVLTSSTLGVPYSDNSSVFRGAYIPPGNGLNLTTTASQQTQAIIYYYQQNR